MVCAETSKRRARSSTITRPKARAMLRISDWRWVRPVTTIPRDEGAHGAAVPASGQRGRSASMGRRDQILLTTGPGRDEEHLGDDRWLILRNHLRMSLIVDRDIGEIAVGH